MADITVEKNRARANGAVVVDGFTGGVRSLETPNLEMGDTWTFPTSYEVWKDPTFGEFIFITLENGNVKRFFPSSFTKSRAIYEADEKGKPIPVLENGQVKRLKTEGSAAVEFRKYGEIKEAMKVLADKKVTISKVVTAKTPNYNNPDRLQNTQFLTIDFVED